MLKFTKNFYYIFSFLMRFLPKKREILLILSCGGKLRLNYKKKKEGKIKIV